MKKIIIITSLLLTIYVTGCTPIKEKNTDLSIP